MFSGVALGLCGWLWFNSMHPHPVFSSFHRFELVYVSSSDEGVFDDYVYQVGWGGVDGGSGGRGFFWITF